MNEYTVFVTNDKTGERKAIIVKSDFIENAVVSALCVCGKDHRWSSCSTHLDTVKKK